MLLVNQGTWTLIPGPPHRKIIGCKWIFKIKTNTDGTVARLVSQSFSQKYGLDYTENFSPVVKQPTIQVVFSMALHFSWSIYQLDVSNAFLHCFLDDEVYMHQPKDYVDQTHPTYVCKLRKALYGLK